MSDQNPKIKEDNRQLTDEERRHINFNTNLELAILNRSLNKLKNEIVKK